MDFRKLSYFVVLAEVGNFTKAANQLRISQPSLTNAIQMLEEEIGFKVFERTKRSIILTDSGLRLYKSAKNLLNQHEALIKEVPDFHSHGTGQIQIGMIESVKYWIPTMISKHLQEYPEQTYRLHEILIPEQIIESLENFETHFCISSYQPNLDFIQSDFLYQEEWVLVTNQPRDDYPIDLETLGKLPLILTPPGHQTDHEILDTFAKVAIQPNVKFEVEHFQTALSLVDKGLGMTIVPKNYISFSPFRRELHAYPLSKPSPKRNIYLLYNNSRYLPESAKELINICKSLLK
ncbi:LysR family transcriptional regulator [Gracilibacillus timonensis]|uniref:LysR family transcriptional regulator n=1 Tax=Gracilibacillus timonensis TaxID=1816696 RepID=UPI00098FD5E9|nr:LysR family transcriptional regulator [Gracilibacillus timonensis]